MTDDKIGWNYDYPTYGDGPGGMTHWDLGEPLHYDSTPTWPQLYIGGNENVTLTFPQKKTIYTGGSFDLFHRGHVNLLKRCRKVVGDDGRVVVSLNPDDLVLSRKGHLAVPYEDRKSVLEACRYVDEVVENTGREDSKPAILKVRPDFIAIGMEEKFAGHDTYYDVMGFTQEWLDIQGIMLIYLPYTQGISCTDIRRRINEA